MKRESRKWTVATAGLVLLTAGAASAQDRTTYLDGTNRLSLSLRFGLNIHARFKGIGNGFGSAPAPRQTPDGDLYNYDDGYVLTDVSGNAGGQTWYWGYDNSSQVSSQDSTVTFNQATAVTPNGSTAGSADSAPYLGVEVAYDRQIGVIEKLHHMRYGVEFAANYMRIAFQQNNTFGATVSSASDTYSYENGTTPPDAPYQGTYDGPGFLLNVPPIDSNGSINPDATILSQDDFDGDLFGFRLGPYLQLPLGKSERFQIAASGGLAVGLLNANSSWKQTLTIPQSSTIVAKGGGEDFAALVGYYAAVNANWQLTDRWGLQGGVQFQDLGTYSHKFDGRQARLDLRQSIFFLFGVSYSF
jgi:hypothetical protein